MGTVVVNGKSVEIGEGERLNCVQAGQRAGVDIPHYCWHPALTVVASCRMCLVETGEKKPDGTIAMRPQACSRLPDAGQRRHGHRHRQQEGEGRAGAGPRVLAAQPSARLPRVRPGGRVLACRTTATVSAAPIRGCTIRKSAAKQGLHRRPDHAVYRSLRDVLALRAVHAGDQRHCRAADHQPRQPRRDRHLSRRCRCNNKLAGNVVDICPVGALCSKDFLYKQRVWWLQVEAQRLPRLQHGLQHQRRPEQGTSSIA